MRAKQIEVGGTYTAKVSGTLTRVEVLRIGETSRFGGSMRTVYYCRNLRTGRDVFVRSPQRFRDRVESTGFAVAPSGKCHAGATEVRTPLDFRFDTLARCAE